MNEQEKKVINFFDAFVENLPRFDYAKMPILIFFFLYLTRCVSQPKT